MARPLATIISIAMASVKLGLSRILGEFDKFRFLTINLRGIYAVDLKSPSLCDMLWKVYLTAFLPML